MIKFDMWFGLAKISPIRTWFHFKSSYEDHVAIYIAENLIFHERTKYVEVDCYLVQVTDDKIIHTRHVSSTHQLANVLTKPLGKTRVDFICDKLGIYDVYAPAWGEV